MWTGGAAELGPREHQGRGYVLQPELGPGCCAHTGSICGRQVSKQDVCGSMALWALFGGWLAAVGVRALQQRSSGVWLQ